MKDIVLKGFIDSFADARGISKLSLSDKFEAFTTSALLRKYHQTDITGMEDDVLVGGGGDGGIDAIALLVNGRLVSTDEGLQFFFESHGRLDVEFAFVQAKSSPSFSAAEIGNFVFGVTQFFKAVVDSKADIRFKPEIQQKIDLTRTIYSQVIKMHDHPKCSLYFASTGKWKDAPEPKAHLMDGKSRLQALNLFSDVKAVAVDADSLKTTFRELERSVVKEVEFIRSSAFPRIDGVGEAYIGLLPGDQFIKLVSTDDGELNRELFFDNVRDFQGHNPVNREIEHTLSDEQLRNSFPLLNNGITIIAGSIKRTADTFQIHDFQIVNGCQTTHILFRNRQVVGKETFIPVKLVATDDSQVVNEVIKATNRQTAVLPEALESLSAFHRELEDLYNLREAGKSSTERIYYERRSKQYAIDNIRTSNIVSLTGQIKSFIGMFLNEPHSHPRYYGELLKAYEGRIFGSDHRPEPYYASGVSLQILEKQLNASTDWRDLRPYKFQLLMLLRASISGAIVPRMNSHAISSYSLKVVDALRDPIRGPKEINRVVDMLKSSLKEFHRSGGRRRHATERNPPHRLRAFTEQLVLALKNEYPTPPDNPQKISPSVGTEYQGAIKYFDDVKGYGFISIGNGEDIFVHVSETAEIPYHLRIQGMDVRFTLVDNPRMPGRVMAGNVRLVPIRRRRRR